ncbi:MAG TPA: 30S ribosomal protein S27ae [Nanoarchaeota archaeon]|nr:30S ribosomal protein S27ae [Nanoarchaeota archaeon]
MSKKKLKNKKASVKYKKYSMAGDKVARKQSCPKCGPGVFLAEHKDRQTCGLCRYTVFKK